MVALARVFRLDSSSPDGVHRFMGDYLDGKSLAEGKKSVVVTITRTGTFHDPRYGEFDISKEMLLSMVRNFDADVFGQKIVLDVSHNPGNGAAGFFKRIFLDGNKLRGEVELTDYGIESITKKGFIYLSAEFSENFTDNEARKQHGPTLLGAGLTPRPCIKRLDPVQLAEGDTEDDVPVYISERIIKRLSEERTMWKELIKQLGEKLGSLKLAESIVKKLCLSFEDGLKGVSDEAQAKLLMENFFTTCEASTKQLAETGGNAVINLSMPDTGLSVADVKKLFDEQREAEAETTRKLAEQLDGNVNLYKKLLNEADGLKDLPDDQKNILLSVADSFTAEMPEATVRLLAEQQIELGNKMSISLQLATKGFQGGQGSVQVSVDESNSIKSLEETILKALRQTSQHSQGTLILAEEMHPFCTLVLEEFDRLNAPQLIREHKLLAGGETSISDTSLPKNFIRTVIRESLSDLNVLHLVQTLTDFGATATTDIPYETRDTSGVLNDGIVYEGQPIHRASVSQSMDLAYVLPMKLAFLISNEVMHFTQTSRIDWNAYARNVESNARVMRELIARRICNELQRSADAYMAVDVAAEGIDGQLDGATSVVKTAQFPIVRPHQQYDLKGNAVGSAENAITIRLDGTAIDAYDGSGDQAVGTYYRVTNYNLGYIQFVDQTGTLATPPNAAGVDNIDYSYATNVEKFDLDTGTTELGLHLNGLLRTVGNRKAMMDGDRYVKPNFMLMSPQLNNTITNANNFEVDSKRNGTDTNNDGDLEKVKGVAAFGTNAPAVDLGDERLILGQRGTLTYTITKPFTTGEPFEAVNAAGKAIGKKQAYGEEYSAIKVPTPIRNRLTSVLAYSAGSR